MATGDTTTPYGPYLTDTDLQTVPNSPANLTTTDTWIFQLTLAVGSASTITIQDRASSPKYLMNAVSLPANSTTVIVFPEGQKMAGGVTWSAGTLNAVHASVVARKK